MDRFELIDMEHWARAEEYRLFADEWLMTYSMTKHLPAEKTVDFLKARKIKLVPALIWIVSEAFNRCENFRLAVKDGKLGKWEVIHPMFPTLNADKNLTIHSLRYTDDFECFYNAYLKEQAENADKTSLWLYEVPANSFMISVFPFVHFDGSSMHFSRAKDNYAPFFAIGKYDEQKKLPCMLAGNHAVADGWHVAEVFDSIQKRLDDPAEWCKFTKI